MNPFLFIVGCPRSGTTLLRRMVDAHPQVAITRETHWIPRYFVERIGLSPEGLVGPGLIPALLEDRRFAHMEIGPEDLQQLRNGETLSYADFVTRIFDHYGQAKGKALVGDKTPGYVRNLSTLHQLWPSAKIVHLIRDGRDVCLSTVEWGRVANVARHFSTWKENPMSAAAVWWEWNVRLGLEAGRPLGPGLYYEMRYESLVSEPAAECAGLCAFLGLPFDKSMLEFHRGRTKAKPGRDAKSAWLPVTPGLRDWRTQMAVRDLERVEAMVGGLLTELKYARAVSVLPNELIEHAAKIRETFAAKGRTSAASSSSEATADEDIHS